MHVAVEGARSEAARATDRASGRPSLAGLVHLSVLAGLMCAAVLFGAGSSDDRLFSIGVAATLAGCLGLAAALAGFVPRPSVGRAGAVSLVALSLFVLFNALTIRWSVAPDRSWAYANRAFVYLMFLVLGLLGAAVLKRPMRMTAAVLALAIAAAVAWALAGKIVPALFPDGARIARLRAPVDYWNALALLCVLGLPLGLWPAGSTSLRRALRATATAFVYALMVAAALTYSRGGIVVGAAAALAWLALSSARFESIVTLVTAVPVAAAVSAWAFTQPGIADNFQPYAVRVRDGWQFGVVFALGAALVWALHVAAMRYEAERRLARLVDRLGARRLAALAGVLVVALAAGFVVRVGDPFTWLDSRVGAVASPAEVSQGPSRLGDLSSNNRRAWWGQAWSAFTAHPLGGTGAATFELTNLRLRKGSLTTTEPHNVPLQFLSETGLGGFSLLAVAVLAGAVAVRKALRRVEGPERAAAAALAAGVAAYALHSVVDKDWDYVAVSAPLFVGLGVLLGGGRTPSQGRGRPLLALGAVVLAWAALCSLAAPWLSARLVDQAYTLIGRDGTQAERSQNFDEAVRVARRARTLDPLALDPLFAEAAALDEGGIETAAHKLYYHAVKVQPQNPTAWYELGTFEFDGQRNNAFNHLNRAYELDPYGPAGPQLDALREIFRQEKQKCFQAVTC
jgi:O-antigen ligase